MPSTVETFDRRFEVGVGDSVLLEGDELMGKVSSLTAINPGEYVVTLSSTFGGEESRDYSLEVLASKAVEVWQPVGDSNKMRLVWVRQAGWQPAKTAPRHGERVLALRPSSAYHPAIVRWDDVTRGFMPDGDYFPVRITHWRPLPERPEEAGS